MQAKQRFRATQQYNYNVCYKLFAVFGGGNQKKKRRDKNQNRNIKICDFIRCAENLAI